MSNIGGIFNNFEEVRHGADLNSDGTIAGRDTASMYDSDYGGMLVQNQDGDDRIINFYQKKVSPQLSQMERDVEHTLNRLDTQIANTDDPQVKQELLDVKDQLQDEWAALQDDPPALVMVNGRGAGNVAGFQRAWNDRLDRMSDMLGDAQAEVGSAGAQSSAGGVHNDFQPLPPLADLVRNIDTDAIQRALDGVKIGGGTGKASGAKEASQADSASEASGSTSEASGPSEASSSEGTKSMSDIDIDAMVTKMSTDPQAAMEELQDLPAEERGAVLQAINTQLQQINQMFSMMSNMMKSMHDTAKAVINNMRV